jgi:WD40 repeat protein
MNAKSRTAKTILLAACALIGGLAASSTALAQMPDIIWSHDDVSGGVTSVSFSPDGRFLSYSASGDADVRIRRASDGALLRTFTTNTIEGVDQVAFAPSGQALASTWNRTQQSGGYTFYFGGLEIWTASSPPPLETGTHSNYVTCLAWAPDSGSVVSGSSDRSVILWDAATGQEIRRFYHGAWIRSVAFSPDGVIVASGAADNEIWLWNAADGSLIRTLTGHTDYVSALEFSPDGTLLASGAGGFNTPDNTIKIWQVSDGALLDTFSGHTNWINDIDFALNGAVLGSASRDGTIRFWRTADGTELLYYDLGGAIPMSLDVAPNNRTFAYGLNNGTVVHAAP